MQLRHIIFILLFFLWGSVGCGTSTNLTTDSPNQSITDDYQEPDLKITKQVNQPHSDFVYKTIGSVNLKLFVYQPSASSNTKQTAIILFHGGAWTNGAPVQFQHQAANLAGHGIVSITVEYRLKKTHGTTPFEALADAKSAIRWVRAHATELKIDPNRIIAAGGSAGGQLAVATAVIDQYDEPTDNLTVSSKPNALVLFNPVLDMKKWGKRFGLDMLAISPLQQLHKPLPPTIIFQGTSDIVAPYSITVDFVNKAQSLKSPDVRLIPYEKREHGFFNKDMDANSDFKTTLKRAYDFIVSLGWATQ